MSSYWAETHFINISILYVYCVTVLLQEIIRNESNCRVSNIGLDHSLVIHLHGHFQETKPVFLVHILYFQGQRATPLNGPMALAMPVDK